MLACVKARDGFREDASFRTWLFTIARHELYAHWRSRQKRTRARRARPSSETAGRAQQVALAAGMKERPPS